MTLKAMVKRLERYRDKVGKQRDDLRDFANEVTALAETCEEAWDDLQQAIEHLSQQA